MSDNEHENRLPYWELHILPMFRLLDHEKMLAATLGDRRIDLYSYEQVAAKATRIIERLTEEHEQSIMPLVTHGGPWPDEWIALFQRWVGKSCPRLSRVAGKWTATRADGSITVRVTFQKPVSDRVWVQPQRADAPRDYVLLHQPGAGGELKEFTLRDVFPDAPGVDYVMVEDTSPSRRVDIT